MVSAAPRASPGPITGRGGAAASLGCMTARVRIGVVATVVVAAVVGTLVLTGALGPRDDSRVQELGLGEPLSTSRADLVVDAFTTGEEPGDVVVTMTVVNHLDESMGVDDLAVLVDDEGELARYGTTTIQTPGSTSTTGASSAQPGVEETFTTVYSPSRDAVGDVRLEISDATWTERDETAFGLGSNMYDERVVAIVRMP